MDKKINKAASKGDASALRKLIQGGADPKGVDKKGNTALHLAAATGNNDACQVLLDAGLDPEVKNGEGRTAADVAEKKKKKATAQFLRTKPAWTSVCSASVAYFSYEQNNWREVESGAQGILELLNQKKDHSYKLSAKVAGKVLIDQVLDKDMQYSGSTDTFHNYAGTKTWGFNFAKEEDARNMLSQIEQAREIMRNPPAAEPVAATSAPAAPSGPPAAPSGGGPPPPPPPPQPKAAAPAAAAAAAPAAPMSMADAIKAKADGGLQKSEDRPAGGGGSGGGGGGGGNMMSELQNRLKKRKTTTTALDAGAAPVVAAESGVVGGTPALRAAGGPNKGQLEEFKKELIEGFRAEVEAVKTDIIETLRADIQAM